MKKLHVESTSIHAKQSHPFPQYGSACIRFAHPHLTSRSSISRYRRYLTDKDSQPRSSGYMLTWAMDLLCPSQEWPLIIPDLIPAQASALAGWYPRIAFSEPRRIDCSFQCFLISSANNHSLSEMVPPPQFPVSCHAYAKARLSTLVGCPCCVTDAHFPTNTCDPKPLAYATPIPQSAKNRAMGTSSVSVKAQLRPEPHPLLS